MGRFNQSQPLSLHGEVICITGEFHCYRKAELAKIIRREFGGEVTRTFTKRNTLLLQGHNLTDSIKLQRAKKQLVPVVGEREFCEHFGLMFPSDLSI